VSAVSEPLDTIVAGLVREARESDWETRFEFFAAAAQALVEFGQTPPAGEVMPSDIPSVPALGEAVVCAFGVAPVVDKYQAAIYLLSPDAMHKAMSAAWQIDHQDEVRELLALMPTIQ
jgi:hypothetical protein